MRMTRHNRWLQRACSLADNYYAWRSPGETIVEDIFDTLLVEVRFRGCIKF